MGRQRYGVRDEVKDTAERFYRALSNKNLKAVDAIWAHVPYAAVAGRSGTLRQGWEQVRRYWEERFQQLGDTRVSVRLTHLVCHAVGDVAWLSGTEIRTIVEGDQVRREDLRVTCVLQRREDEWQIVSYHASLPASGASEKPVELASAS
jgi:ketosteroid isomerase-like protein